LVDDADPEVVFLCGEVRSLADLVAELPERVAERVAQLHAGTRKSHCTEEELRELTGEEFARRRGIEMSALAQRFEAEIGRGSGRAAQGLADVCTALRDGNVDTLIVGELGDATVVTGAALTMIAADADALSELGEPVGRVARADEALPFNAIAVGASLVRAGQLVAPADGVGALLRYAVGDRVSRRGA
ncbi:MAG: baeRF2 domain-containing protein, partial [Mycobacterium sp.]